MNTGNNIHRENNEKNINTRNLGGWLMAVQIFIILNAISWLRNLSAFYELYGDRANLIRSKGASDPSLYNFFIYFELAAGIIFTFLSFAVFYYFFKRNRHFPLIMTGYLILELLVDTASYFIFLPITGPQDIIWQKLLFSFVVAVLIIIYLKISVRVKLTYIH